MGNPTWLWLGSWLAAVGVTACTNSEKLPATSDAGSQADVAAGADAGNALQGTMICGNIPVATRQCASCADDHCCGAGEACAGNPECVALRACQAACIIDDKACADACSSAHAGGQADNAVLSACRLRWCGVQCFDSTGAECGFQLPPAACNDCAQSKCCEVGWVSNTQPSFWSYQDCVANCADAGCFQTCASENPEGRDNYMAFIGCLGTHCAEACAVQPAATCGGFYAEPCGACVSASCCDESTACLLDPACQTLQRCVGACSGDACVSQCESASPGAVEALADLDACLASSCGSECL